MAQQTVAQGMARMVLVGRPRVGQAQDMRAVVHLTVEALALYARRAFSACSAATSSSSVMPFILPQPACPVALTPNVNSYRVCRAHLAGGIYAAPLRPSGP